MFALNKLETLIEKSIHRQNQPIRYLLSSRREMLMRRGK